MRLNFLIAVLIFLTIFRFAMGQTADAPATGDGTSGNPYQIATLNNLYWITENSSRWDKYYIQTSNIDASGTSSWFSGAGWSPIGNNSTAFSGNYNGQDYSISGLYINRNSSEGMGLFGSVTSANIRNINLSGNITVVATEYLYAAGLIGKSSNSTISDCNINCTISASVTGVDGFDGKSSYSWVAGISARINGGTLTNCSSIVNIDVNITNSNGMMAESFIGGIAGELREASSSGCSSSGTIDLTGDFTQYYSIRIETGGVFGRIYNSTVSGSNSSCTITGTNYVGYYGGFAGSNYGSSSLLSNSYASGAVEGSEPGGFLGTTAEATTTNCFSTGNVRGSYNGGGFASTTAYNSVLRNCYSKGTVSRIPSSDRDFFGGFAGFVESCTIDKCYSTGAVIHEGTTNPTNKGFSAYTNNTISGSGNFWDTENSLQTTNSGTTSATGKTSSQMKTQSTFTEAGWDFVGESVNGTNDYWAINPSNNNGYPYLSWQNFTVTPSSQPTNLIFSNSGTNPYNVELSFTPSESAAKYLVVRKISSAPSFIPSDGTEYTSGAQGDDYILYSGTDTSATDAAISENTYFYKIYAFNGSGSGTKYLLTDPLSGYTIISLDGTSSITNTGSNPVSAGFPSAGVNVTFTNGTTGTNLTVTKTNSVPASNFAALPGVRGMKNLYFTITSSEASPGTYTLILDFSSLPNMDGKWNSFKIMKRANSTEAWKDVTAAPINAAIVNRQTDGVWGKFTISGLTSFSEFGGGEESVTHTVTSASNDINVANSLRNLINSSVAGDVITFDIGAMGTNTITLADSAIFIYKDLTIRGVDGGVTLNGNNTTMVLAVGESINDPLSPVVRLEKLKITGGDDTQNRVGGIDNYGDLTMVNCLVADNTDTGVSTGTGAIGGILSNGDLTLVNCTVAGNTGAPGDNGIGGIYCAGNWKMYNSIVYGNQGEYTDIGENITVSRNSLYGDLNGYLILDSENDLAEGTNPQFNSSGDHPYLIKGISPCADAGNNSFCFESKDIRGTDRKLNKDDATSGTIDIGAYEYKFGEDPLPVELASFSANVSNIKVILNWQTNTEINNYGFEVERKPLTVETGHPLSLQNPTSPIWSKIGFVSGAGNSNSVKEYSFTDKDIKGGKYQYRLKQIDNDGKFSYSEVIEVDVALPVEFKLEQNYPNPFNPSTTIRFGLPVDSRVVLELYNIVGEKIATLIDAEMEAGYHNYQLSTSNHRLSSGVYFYKLSSQEFSAIKKLIMIK